MGAPAAGTLVLVPFPFSDLSASKLRPAVVLAHAGRGDMILCQVTSNPYTDPLAIEIGEGDFASGSLRRASYARPGKLFTGSGALIAGEAGTLLEAAHARIVEAVVLILRQRASR